MSIKKKAAVFTLKTRTRSYDLEASVRQVGEDFVISIWGGDAPHVGAVAIAQPRPSLKDPQTISSTASVFCVLGHKEDEMAKAISEILSATLNTRVVVTAGIHWDRLSPEGILRVIRNSEVLTELILKRIARLKSKSRVKSIKRQGMKG